MVSKLGLLAFAMCNFVGGIASVVGVERKEIIVLVGTWIILVLMLRNE